MAKEILSMGVICDINHEANLADLKEVKEFIE